MTQNNISKLLASILTNHSLSESQLKTLFNLTEQEDSALPVLETYLMLLNKRGAESCEILTIVKLLLGKAKRLKVRQKVLDVCGTGGDKSNSFNVSTTVAFVLAAAGIPVLKHGNRSVSSKCGSSDLLESLGISIEKASKDAVKTLRKFNIGYLHAPFYHPFFARVAPLRKKIGQPTIFNALGPLLHPASPKYQLTGVANEQTFHQYPQILKDIGRTGAIVVRGAGGMDEATPFGVTRVYELIKGKIKKELIDSRKYGFRSRGPGDLTVHRLSDNKSAFENILSGKEKGPKAEAVYLNAGLGFMVTEKVKNLQKGIELAKKTIESGKCTKLLKEYIEAVK